jgi:hypothetical protein
VAVPRKSEAAGTYEGLLLDANPTGTMKDGAVARGWISVSVSRTGSVSGRVQYVEAGSLAGAPSEDVRVYQPVVRSFSGVLSAAGANEPLKSVASLRLGVGSQAGRQELSLVLDRGGDAPLLTAIRKDKVSLPMPALSLSSAPVMRQALTTPAAQTPAYASAAGRYILSASPGTAATVDNNAQLLVQVLTSGRILWTGRLTRYNGSGSASLTAHFGNLLLAAVYEGRSVSGTTGLTSNAVFGELRFARTLEGWEPALGNDRLEHARTRVAGSRQESRFVAAYSAPDFASGAQFSEVRNVDFSNAFA